MAFFNDLAKAIAEVEGMDEMTVIGIGQYARDAGYLAKGGRGRSAAKMTPRDAANLLIAVNATAKAKDAASAIETFRNLKGKDQTGTDHDVDSSDPFEVALRSGIDFGSALEILIQEFIPTPGEELTGYSDLFISFERPNPTVTVDVGDYSDPDDPEQYFYTIFGDPQIAGLKSGSDRRDVTTISSETLSAVGRVLAT